MADIELLKAFIRDRLPALKNLGVIGDNLADAVGDLLLQAELYADAEFPNFEGGYASASEDALLSIATIWKHHQDFGCWER